MVEHLLALAEHAGVLEDLAEEIRRRGMLQGEDWRDELRSTIREELARTKPLGIVAGGRMTVAQAAEHAGIKPATVRAWIKSGRLLASMAGNRWRIEPANLEAALSPAEERVDLDAEASRILHLNRQRRDRRG